MEYARRFTLFVALVDFKRKILQSVRKSGKLETFCQFFRMFLKMH